MFTCVTARWARRSRGAFAPSAVTLVLALANPACVGVIPRDDGSGSSADPAQSGSSSSGDPNKPGSTTTPPSEGALPPPPGASPECQTPKLGATPIRRLTRAEFDNTVRDLLGQDLGLAAEFPPDAKQYGFDNIAEFLAVNDVLSEKYVGAARKIAETAVANLGEVVGCDPAASSEMACLDDFFEGFGQRIWRRPLSEDEKANLRQRFTEGRLATFADGIDAVIQVMVLSPQFLYRVEVGAPVAGASYARLTDWEMASRLSYLIWGSMPDDALFTAARAGKLGTREEIQAQAKRMLEDPRAAGMWKGFARQWLSLESLQDLDKDTALYPAWKPELAALFGQETERFVEEVWNTDGKIESLLTAPYTFANAELAALYGVRGATGESFSKVDLDTTQRRGLLTQASFLATQAKRDQSSPIHRGVFIQHQIACVEIPDPPADLDVQPVMFNENQTTKERFAAHRANPACAACHDLIDPVGFGFENFDALGAWRTMDAGKPVDASGELKGTDVDGKFTGAVELAQMLGKSVQVRDCMVRHWFHFGFGRGQTSDDQCSYDILKGAFSESNGNLRELVLALTRTDAFLYRQGVKQ